MTKYYIQFYMKSLLNRQATKDYIITQEIMNKIILKSSQHIANKQELARFECSACYELNPHTLMCKGPCARPYCVKCIGRIKYIKDRCPCRCSEPFQCIPISELVPQYSCPYDPDNCCFLCTSQKEFYKHCQQCEFITASGKQQMRQKEEFLCEKGHKLKIFTNQCLEQLKINGNFYTTVMNDICSHCERRTLCRAICMTCSSINQREVYCVECRTIPLTKFRCPKGHNFTKEVDRNNFACVCDICGISAPLMSREGFKQLDCDIYICGHCYQGLPRPQNRSRSKSSIF